MSAFTVTLSAFHRNRWPPSNVNSVRLHRNPQKLVEIDTFTEQMFGRYQADAYSAGFEKTFELLATFPRIGRSADELKAGYRRYRHQSHHVFYTEEADHVLIRTIIHIAQDLRPDLID